ncbi:hypothetical protein GQ600_22930 [Phytophthora cactorum]|nr:hypothetical protein GQ600_22930 [Phytophthora cactorum]
MRTQCVLKQGRPREHTCRLSRTNTASASTQSSDGGVCMVIRYSTTALEILKLALLLSFTVAFSRVTKTSGLHVSSTDYICQERLCFCITGRND